MGIYTAPGVLAYKVNGNKLNTLLTLSAGTYNSVVQEWDNCGGSSTAPVVIHVGGGGPTGKSGQFSNLPQMSGWTGYALLPPLYNICDSCRPGGPQTTWSMTQGISSPSLSGKAARMDIGGQTVYSDGLWNNHLVGDFSSRGLPDNDRSIIPAVHNFTVRRLLLPRRRQRLPSPGVRYQPVRAPRRRCVRWKNLARKQAVRHISRLTCKRSIRLPDQLHPRSVANT